MQLPGYRGRSIADTLKPISSTNEIIFLLTMWLKRQLAFPPSSLCSSLWEAAAAEAIIKVPHFLPRHFLIGQPTTLVGKVVGQICTLNVSACLRQQKTHRQELRIIFGKKFKPTYPYHPFLCRVTLSLHECRPRLTIPGVQQRVENVSLMTGKSTHWY